MSTVAHALRRRQVRSIAISPDLIAAAGLTLIGAVVGALTWRAWGDLGQDTGYDLVAGSRLAHGQLPYLDFPYYYGPLGPVPLALGALIGGYGIGSAIAVGIVVSAAIVAATYAVARTQTGALGAFLAAALTAGVAFSPTNMSYVLPHTETAPLAILFALCFLAAAGRYAATRRTAWLCAAGMSAGLVALTRPEFELAVVVAGAVWLVLLWRERRIDVRGLAALVLPAVAIPAAVYGAFVAAGVGLHSLVFDNLYPTRVLHAGGETILRSHAPMTISSFATLGVRGLAYAAGIAGLTVVCALVVRRPRAAWLVTGAIVVVFAAGAAADLEAVRTGLKLVYGWIPLGAVVLAVALIVRRLRGRQAQGQDDVALLSVLVLAVLAAKTYDAFFLHATRVQPAVYAAPFAAVFLTRLHLGTLARSRALFVAGALWLTFLAVVGVALSVKDARAKSASVSGPGGSLAVTPGDAAMYGGALAAIARYTRSGEPVLLAPQLSALYVLADRRDPLPQISLLPGALAPGVGEKAAIARLSSENVRLAVVDRRRLTEYGQGAFGGSFDLTLDSWLSQHFTRITTLRPSHGSSDHALDIWLRRGS